MPDSLHDLTRAVDAFETERDWHQFHAPKNIASALIVEAAELLEPFQWMSEQQSRELNSEQREQVAGEMADVLLYLVQLGNVLGIDPVAAAQAKLERNAQRYPVDKARGSSRKHDQL
jgi:NTP pyrophosphatase (non-canonical NTP hydrolase)